MDHIHRGMNFIADELSKLAAERSPVPVGTFIEVLVRPSITPKSVAGAPSTSMPGAHAALPRAGLEEVDGAPSSSMQGSPVATTSKEAASRGCDGDSIPGELAIMVIEGTAPT